MSMFDSWIHGRRATSGVIRHSRRLAPSIV